MIATISTTKDTSNRSIIAGRVLSGLIVAMFALDGVMKLFKPVQVTEAMAKLGYPDSQAAGIGALLLACTLLYAIRSTSVLGAILLTGYLGGATATNLRVQSPTFSVVFPAILGVMLWAGIYLRDNRLRALIPLRND